MRPPFFSAFENPPASISRNAPNWNKKGPSPPHLCLTFFQHDQTIKVTACPSEENGHDHVQQDFAELAHIFDNDLNVQLVLLAYIRD